MKTTNEDIIKSEFKKFCKQHLRTGRVPEIPIDISPRIISEKKSDDHIIIETACQFEIPSGNAYSGVPQIFYWNETSIYSLDGSSERGDCIELIYMISPSHIVPCTPDPIEATYEKLKHFHDSNVGLWATDRPDLIPEDMKHLYHRIDPVI